MGSPMVASAITFSSILRTSHARTAYRTMACPARWSSRGSCGSATVVDSTPTALVLGGLDSLKRGDRVSIQIRCAGTVRVVAGTVTSSSKVLGGHRVALDRPDNRLFADLWASLA